MDALVSIGLPVYNGAKYLRVAFDSILNQDYDNFELIVSDNASTDETPEIIAEFAASDMRIKHFRQDTNIGAESNFKFVLDKAIGQYFMWIAHDDARDSNWISILLSEFRDGDLGVCGGVRFLRSDGVFVRYLRNYPKRHYLTCFMGNECNYRCCFIYALFRRDILTKADFNPVLLDYSPDYIFVYSLLKLGNLRATNKTLMSFRVHSANAGGNYTRPWKGWKKNIYRVHPLRYYLYHLPYTDGNINKISLLLSIPFKHIYAQASFWFRGVRELVTGKPFI